MPQVTILSGTADWQWPELAEALTGNPQGRLEKRPAGDIEQMPLSAQGPLICLPATDSELVRLLRSQPQTKGVFVCGPPALTMEEQDNRVEQSPAVLDEWAASAALLLGLWRRNRSRIHIVERSECSTDPGAFCAWLSQVSGHPLPFSSDVVQPRSRSAPALRSLISGAAVCNRPEIQRLWEELKAARHPLGDRVAVRNKVARQAMDELTGIEAAVEGADLEMQRLRVSLAAARHERNAAFSEKQGLEQALASLQRDLGTTAVNGLGIAETLLEKLRGTQIEAENYFERWKSLEPVLGLPLPHTGRVLRCVAQNDEEANHAEFLVKDVSFLERRWPEITVRLLQNGDNAGIAILKPVQGLTNPLYHWNPTSEEDGHELMAFWPTDPRSAARLVSAPTSDLLLLRGLAMRLLGNLAVEGSEPGSTRWAHLTARLIRQMTEITERLHYDSVVGSPEREDGELTLRFDIRNLYFRGQLARSMTFLWKPSSSGGELTVAAGASEDELMLDSGSAPARLSFLSAKSEAKAQETWDRFTKRDRAFMTLGAKALPDFIFHLVEQRPDQKAGKQRLVRQARTFLRELRRLERKSAPTLRLANLLRK